MEKCENCNKELSIDSRNEQKRFDAFKERTGIILCSSCRKGYVKVEVQDMVLGAMGKVMGKGHYPFYGG